MAQVFQEKIKKQLKYLTQNNIVFFTWLCAVRSLPFLCVGGNFNCWFYKNSKDEKQKYLFAIMRAVDTAIYQTHTAVYTAAADADDAVAAANVDTDANVAAKAAATAATNAANAAYAAANAAKGANAVYAAAAAADAAVNAAAIFHIDLQPIILTDIDDIFNGKQNFNNDTSLYGEVWETFQYAFYEIDCNYWVNWYIGVYAKGFVLDDNDFLEIEQRLNAPNEYIVQGAAALGHYMENLKIQGAEALNETRIIILGEKGVGKTCLARRLINPEALMTESYESTEGVETTIWNITDGYGKAGVKARIWDFAGHVITHSAHRCFLTERCLYIIVYNAREERDNNLEYWLNHVRNYGEDSPALILVNLRGDDNPPRILENDLRRAYPFILGFAYVNIAAERDKLQSFRKSITHIALNNPSWNKQVIPAGDFRVKERVESLFLDGLKKKPDNITREQFERVAAECGIEPGHIEAVLNSLTQLGAGIWYPELAIYNAVVLNPDWITNGIYKAINWGWRNNRTRLRRKDFTQIFIDEPERYPADKAEYIFKVMNKYDLAYFEGEDIIVPSLLGDMPDKYINFEREFNDDGDLLMDFKSEERLPENIISRFIVRMSDYIHAEGDIWQRGAVISYPPHSVVIEATALIIEETVNRIRVRVTGVKAKEFITAIRDTMNNILNSYRSVIPEPWYKIAGDSNKYTAQENTGPVMISEKDIVAHIETGQGIPLPGTGLTVPARQIIFQYNIVKNFGSINNLIMDNSAAFNYQDEKYELAGEFRSLAEDFREAGLNEEAAVLEKTADKAECNETAQTVNDVKKSGIFAKAKKFLSDATDPSTELHQRLSMATGIIASCTALYNKLADMFQWMKFPLG